jgi:serine/threonine-protein kinase
MSSTEVFVMDENDIGVASTRPSAPRGPGEPLKLSQTVSGSTTLPIVHWSDGGAVLQQSALPRYERLATLGEGGMGEVVRARDNDIGREVAVKRLRPDLQHPELYARFVEEVRTVGQLEHPNIVPIHDAGLDEQGYFFVMKHVDGESLATIIERLRNGDAAAHARWTFERRIDVIRKVLEALRYAHKSGVVHRDIKPANIVVGPMGEVFLIDWGIAKRVGHGPKSAPAAATPAGATHTHAGAVMGTPMYMSPEQARGEEADARSDLYSLCMTLYELLTLVHPFAGITETQRVLEAVVREPIPVAGFVRHPNQPLVPMDMSWVLKKGVDKSPAERFQSADELIRRLDDRAEGKVPIQCPITATIRVNYEVMRWVRHNPIGFTVLTSCMLVGGVVWAFLR